VALDALRAMGGDIEITPRGEAGGEPFGDVRAAESSLRGIEIEPELVPGLIDELPILAVAASQAEGTTKVSGAGELRVKESDRIATMVAGLRALDVQIGEAPDGFQITGPAKLGEADIDSHGDHRVAMSFAVAALIARTDIRIRGWSSVDTSFPGFIETLGRARGMRR
jgi:3-phosphoshikimate 1-carboxyvinyltransferase